MNRIVHFEIHSKDPVASTAFYKKVFGWNIDKWPSPDMEYWFVMTAPKESKEEGINGGLLIRKGDAPKEGQPVNAFVCTVQVEDIDKSIAAILEAGGTLAQPKFNIANMAWQAYYKDLDGNIFGVHQRINSVK